MNTVIPSIKGQITLPPSIRKKYGIDKSTPIVIRDLGEGKIELQVSRLLPLNESVVDFYEKELEDAKNQYKNGLFVSGEELMKRYGL